MLAQEVEALEETRTQLLVVVKPIFASAVEFQPLPPAAAQAQENTKLFLSSRPASQSHAVLAQVVEALEETRTQLLLVTEPIFASAADLLARFQTLPPAAAQARESTKLSELEIKAGLLQVH